MTGAARSDPVAPGWAKPRQPVALTFLKAIGVACSSALFVVLLVRIAGAVIVGTPAWLAVPAFLIGYLLADLVTGTAHWFCDTFFDEDTAIIGKVLIQPFRDHHLHPQRITEYGFLEQDTTSFFLLLPALAWTSWLGAPQPGEVAALAGCSGLAGLATGLFGTNLFHKWAHRRRPPAVARWLQRFGVILGPVRHQKHHRDYSRGYCVTSGWLNPVLDAWKVFPRTERWVRRFRR